MGMNAEVIVVDNNSADESVACLQKIFPQVKFIANKENTGYAKANNQGWQIAAGNYILFLNPDTILAEDCLQQSVNMLQSDDRLGALGIHMIDGSGRFLPESKRGFPSPRTSFFKLSGLIKIFPHSPSIARYYLGHLPEKENNEIEVLTGAYMMVKKEVLKKTGGFDERFFMYGEDIDLSYRIIQAGYKNYYLANSSIIHFKGESTKKDIVYTKMFYKAMRLFVEKYYGEEWGLFSAMMQLAIAVRGVLSFTNQFFLRRQPLTAPGKSLHTIIVGSPAEIQKAVEVLGHQTITRNLISVADTTEINAAIQLQQADEIIFCAGIISYNVIIGCIESMRGKGNIDYKFFAAGSNCIVGSMSKTNSGETVVLS